LPFELNAETEMKTEISEDDFANAKRVNEGGIWRPRRDLNPHTPKSSKKEKS